MTGDSQAMLDARSHFFETGSFDPIADAVATASLTATTPARTDPATFGRQQTGSASPPLRIAELGCGTGFYLEAARRALNAAGRDPDIVAADLSPAAVRMAVRGVPGATGVVLDVWQPLPFLGNSLDGILSVFAPRNLPEFARVLAPGGFLVAVVPTTRHLQEIRADGLAIGIPDGKPEALSEAASPWFTEEARTLVEFAMTLEGPALADVIGMGPSAHHGAASTSRSADMNDVVSGTDGENQTATDAGRRVTASVTVLTYRLKPNL